MRVIVNPFDSQSLYSLAQSEIYQMPMQDLYLCLQVSHDNNQPLVTIFRKSDVWEFPEPLSPEALATIERIITDCDSFQQKACNIAAYALLYTFLKETGYLKKIISSHSVENEEKISNIASFFTTVQNYSHFTEQGDLAFFVRHLDLLKELGDDPGMPQPDTNVDAVNVMTIHKSKGLEFPVVFMVGLVDKKFPTKGRRSTIDLPDDLIRDNLPEGDFHLQEERRLFYVGMTRAEKELYLTSARDHGGSRPRKVSCFVHEAINDAHSDEDYVKASPRETLARYAVNEHSHSAKELPAAIDRLIRIDPHQVDDYLACPLKYKYIHILRVPLEHHHAVIYGRAIHEAIKEYNQSKLHGVPVTLESLIRVFKANWRSQGFLSRDHEEQRFERGQKVLGDFFLKQESEAVQPAYVEKSFRFMFENIEMTGRWDRVDEFPDGKVVITDFKSSEISEPEKARQRAVRSKQLRIYAWAYEEYFGKNVDSWRLYFLDSGLIGEVKRQGRFIAKIKDEVIQVTEGIRQRDYQATPGPGVCPYCPYQEICPATGVKGKQLSML